MGTMGRRVGSWLLALLVVGALGAGGVVVARSSTPRRPPVLELAAAGGSPSQASATAEARDLTPAQAGLQPSWPRVRYELSVAPPDLPDEARAWRLVPKVGDDQVAELARALGFGARPTATQGGWRVFEGSRLLQVNREFGAPWTFVARVAFNCGAGWSGPDGVVSSDAVVDCPVPGPVDPAEPGRPCPRGTVCAQPSNGAGQEPAVGAGGVVPGSSGGAAAGTASSGTGSGSTGKPVPRQDVPPSDVCRLSPPRPGCRPLPPRPADLPSREEAERIARDWLARAGVPLDGRTVRAVQQWNRWVVTASPTVDGRPTIGDAAEVWVGPKGEVVHASGRSARCVQQETVRRITGIRLGLQHTAVLAAGDRVGRDAWLVPAYLFEINGNPDDVESVIAVPDRYLRIPEPLPAPAKPSSTPDSVPGADRSRDEPAGG